MNLDRNKKSTIVTFDSTTSSVSSSSSSVSTLFVESPKPRNIPLKASTKFSRLTPILVQSEQVNCSEPISAPEISTNMNTFSTEIDKKHSGKRYSDFFKLKQFVFCSSVRIKPVPLHEKYWKPPISPNLTGKNSCTYWLCPRNETPTFGQFWSFKWPKFWRRKNAENWEHYKRKRARKCPRFIAADELEIPRGRRRVATLKEKVVTPFYTFIFPNNALKVKPAC